MSRKTWYIVLVILGLLVLIVDYLFVHVLFPSKKRAFLESLFDTKTQISSSHSLPQNVHIDYADLVKNGTDTFKAALDQCQVTEDLGNIENPRDLVETLQEKVGIRHRNILQEVITFRTHEGENRRIHLNSVSNNPEITRELLLFALQENNLPVPMELDPEKTINPTPEFINELLQGQTITYHQVKETNIFDNEMIAAIEWVNNDTKDFQLAIGTKTLFCQYLNCSCQ